MECHPELVLSACIDDVGDVKSVRKLLTPVAAENVLKANTKCKIFPCSTCLNELGKQSVCCDSCLKWFDFKCVALKEATIVHCALVLQGLSFYAFIAFAEKQSNVRLHKLRTGSVAP